MPHVFTEQGIAMLSTTLNSERAIQVNIAIMRTFAQPRQMISTHRELAQKLEQVESEFEKYDTEIRSIFQAIRQLMTEPKKTKRRIGFHSDPAGLPAKGAAGRRRH